MPSLRQPSYAYVNGQRSGAPPPEQGYGNQSYAYRQAPAAYPGNPSTYGAPQARPQAPPLPEALAAILDDQKALIIRVLSMTFEQVSMLVPAERATYMRFRTAFGVPTGIVGVPFVRFTPYH